MWLDFLDDILPKELNPSVKLFIHVLILVQVLAFLAYLAILIAGRFGSEKLTTNPVIPEKKQEAEKVEKAPAESTPSPTSAKKKKEK